MDTAATLVRLDDPADFKPADELSVMPMVSVFDVFDRAALGRAMVCSPNFNAEALETATLDDLMGLVVQGMSRFPVREIKYGQFANEAERALGPMGSNPSKQRLALYLASDRLWKARPETTGANAVSGRREVVGLRLVADQSEEQPRLRVVTN